MDRRRLRRSLPSLEPMEQRALMSLVTAIMAGNKQALVSKVLHGSTSSSGQQGFVPSTSSIAVPRNQGPQGLNLVLTPIGKATPREVRKQLFQATFIGPYTIGPGRYDTEAQQVFIRGAGTSTTMLHADIQVRVVVAKDPTIQNSGASVIFDRNLNSNSALGFNLAGSRESIDSRGRPNRFDSVTIDVNTSAGTYVEGFSQGVLQIKYMPNGKRTLGVLDQGTAIVKFKGQIYAPNVAYILRNSDINP